MKTLKVSPDWHDLLIRAQDLSQDYPAIAMFLAALVTIAVASILSRKV